MVLLSVMAAAGVLATVVVVVQLLVAQLRLVLLPSLSAPAWRVTVRCFLVGGDDKKAVVLQWRRMALATVTTRHRLTSGCSGMTGAPTRMLATVAVVAAVVLVLLVLLVGVAWA
jgi:hypothetical protein